MILSEQIVYTDTYIGTADIITGIDKINIGDVDFDRSTHTYKVNGMELPSVTTLLDDGGYNNINEKILNYAKTKGSIVHEEIENYLKHNLEGFTKEFDDFKDIYIQNIEKFKNKAVFDIKTYSSNSPDKRKKCFIQTLMYAKGIEYLTGINADEFNLYEIWLPHKGKAKLIDLRKEFG